MIVREGDFVSRIIKANAIFLLFVLSAFAVWQPRASAQEKKGPPSLSEALGLTPEQTVLMKDALSFFSARSKDIAAETDLADDERLEKTQRLQREFYEELKKILTKKQIEKYQKYAKEMRKARAAAEEKPKEATAEGEENEPETKFPWFKTLRRGLRDIELSGLQKQGVDELFAALEDKAYKMSFGQSVYDPSQDDELKLFFTTKIQWILTKEQYEKYTQWTPPAEQRPQYETGAGPLPGPPSGEFVPYIGPDIDSNTTAPGN